MDASGKAGSTVKLQLDLSSKLADHVLYFQPPFFKGDFLVSARVVDPDPSNFTLFQVYETNSSPKMKIEAVGSFFPIWGDIWVHFQDRNGSLKND